MKYLLILILIILSLNTLLLLNSKEVLISKDPLAQQIEAIGSTLPTNDLVSIRSKAEAIKQIIEKSQQ